jgi:hypothetical protein
MDVKNGVVSPKFQILFLLENDKKELLSDTHLAVTRDGYKLVSPYTSRIVISTTVPASSSDYALARVVTIIIATKVILMSLKSFILPLLFIFVLACNISPSSVSFLCSF